MKPENTTTKMKPLPCACNKQRLRDRLVELSRTEVNEKIYEVIMDNRKIDLEAAKRVVILRKNEVYRVMVELGEIDL